jgi:hypothetical protein
MRAAGRLGAWRVSALAGAVLAVLVVAGVGTARATMRPEATPSTPPATSAPPPANAGFDYQIGEPYRPPAGVRVVSRDHDADPAAGLYNICYVNGFQTQTEAAKWWQTNHNDLLLRQNGKLVVDGDWNEILLDIRTATNRAARMPRGWPSRRRTPSSWPVPDGPPWGSTSRSPRSARTTSCAPAYRSARGMSTRTVTT